MDESLDIIRHNEEMISVRDMSHDLEISQSKWDDFFEYLMEDTFYVYFHGSRRWVNDDNFLNTIDNISEKILVDDGKYHAFLLCRLKMSAVIISRNQISKMFYYYEHPMLVFLRDIKQEAQLIQYARMPLGSIPLINYPHLYMVSRDSQLDVLWFRKSADMSFPWNTRRSPVALIEESSKSWFKVLLNKLGW